MPVSANRQWSYVTGLLVALFIGAVFGLLFTAVALVVLIVEGPGPFEAEGISVGEGIALYFAGFLLAGLISGLLNPLAKSLPGAILLGIVAVVPMTLGMNFLLTGQFIPHDGYVLAAVVFPVVFGGSMGYFAWREFIG